MLCGHRWNWASSGKLHCDPHLCLDVQVLNNYLHAIKKKVARGQWREVYAAAENGGGVVQVRAKVGWKEMDSL